MSLAYRSDVSSPFVRAFLADRGSELPGLDLAIDGRDEMLGFLVDGMEGDRDKALFAYFRTGQSIADALLQVLRWRFPGGPRKVLDFASGYGRITRFLVREVPPERLWVADVYEGGVRFQEERFGVHGVVSTLRPEDLELGETFDAILVTSLFTHLPEERFLAWLHVLCGRLEPGGLLAFSTHDLSLLPCPPMPESGLLFQEISESGSLDTRDYGSTWVTEAFVRDAVAEAARSIGRGASVHRLERGLCNYQDLYLAVLEPGVDFSGLRYTGEPYLSLEHCGVSGAGLEMSGWAAVRTGEVEAVEVILEGQLLAELPIAHPRPDVAGMLGEPRYLRSGWMGACALPPGTSRGSSVLVIRVRDGRGVSHPLRAGSVESLLLESARNEASARQRELREARERLADVQARTEAEIGGLRARIAAMESSRFWKMRNAWFRLKRGLGLTDEDR